MEEEFIKTFGQDGVNLSCSCWYHGTRAYLFTIHVRGIEQINAQNFSFYGDIIDVNDSGLAEMLKARIVPKKLQDVVLVYDLDKRQMLFQTPKSGLVIKPEDEGENDWSKLLGLVGRWNSYNYEGNNEEQDRVSRLLKAAADSIEYTEWDLLSKKIVDSMGNSGLHFVIHEGIGGKVVDFKMESILHVGNNGLVLSGIARFSGQKPCRGKWVDDIRKMKVFYNATAKKYVYLCGYKVDDKGDVRPRKRAELMLPKGDIGEVLENKTNEAKLFSIINRYIESVNAKSSSELLLKL